MIIKIRACITVLFFVALLFNASVAGMAWGEGMPAKIGVLAKRGPERCLKKWSPTAQYLTAKIPGKAFVLVSIDFEGIFSTVEKGGIDFILANPSFYVELESRYGVNRIATLKNLRLGVEYTQFGGVVFCRANSDDINSLRDLKGRSFMAVDESSLGGWRAAWRELKEGGIDPYRDFTELRFGGTHDAVVYAVRDGKVEAGSVRTDTLERMAFEGKIDINTFRIINEHFKEHKDFPFIHSTRLYPEWPFAKAKHTPYKLAEKVAIALIEMPQDCPAAKAAKCAGWTVPLNYQPVHTCLKELKLGPYRELGKITPADVFKKYWEWILAIVFFLVVVAGASIFLLRLNRKIRASHGKLQSEMDERKRMENALRESEERYRYLVEKADDIIYKTDSTGHFTFFNAIAVKITGYPEQELMGKRYLELIRPDYHEDAKKFYGLQLKKRTPSTYYEFPMVTKDGKQIWLGQHVQVMVEDDRIEGVHAVARDITKQKQAEEALKESEERYRDLFENASDLIQVVAPDARFVYVNRAWRDTLGYSEEEVTNRSVFDIIDPDSKAHCMEIFQGVLSGQKVDKVETVFVTKDGKKIMVEGSINCKLIDGKPVFTRGIFRDVTERKEMEESIQQRTAELEQKSQEFTEANARLKEKTEKLERTNKLFVDRELRMKELKQEIEVLKRKTQKGEGQS